MSVLRSGWPRITLRGPELLWDCTADATAIATGAIGFADATEEDRARWISSFRRLLDGLDSPLQVVVEVEPGSDARISEPMPMPADFDDMRGADLCFVERIAQSPAARRFTTYLVGDSRQAPRIQNALHEMGIPSQTEPARRDRLFGRELADSILHAQGFSRTWYIERLPGTELEPG